MLANLAFVSNDGKARTKLEYTKDGIKRTTIWENVNGRVLETLFDADGSILLQRLVKPDKSMAKMIRERLDTEGIETAEAKEFSDIKLKRACPSCNKYTLSRHVEAFPTSSELPVMPIYHCANCKKSSYHLTDQYLEYLIENNKNLFDSSEISELSKDRHAFTSDVREHIIRIFASKKIMCIR